MRSFETRPDRISKEQALLLPDPHRLDYFRQVRIKHDRVATALDDIETLVSPESGTDIVLLIGPTGVGKSTLTISLRDRLLKLHQEDMRSDLSFIPVVIVEAPASGERGFSWRIFYVRLGQALHEPLMERKIEDCLEDGRRTIRPINAGSTVAGLRMAIEDALKIRRTVLVIIDEAVHLIRNAKGNTLNSHMDALKSLANICGVTLALVGSYDLFKLMSLSGQIARRSAILHFQRYRPGVAEDEKAFLKSLRSLQKFLPLKDVPDLSPLSGDLMHSCVGCVGILKDTLTRALTFALRNNGKWTDSCLQRGVLAERQIVSILEETLEGEKSVVGSEFGSGTVGWWPETKKKAA